MRITRQKILEILGFDYINSIIFYISGRNRKTNQGLGENAEKKDWKLPPACPHANPLWSVAMFITSNIQCILAIVLTTLCTGIFIYGIIFMGQQYDDNDNGNGDSTGVVKFQYNWFWVASVGTLLFGSVLMIFASILGMMIGIFGCTCFFVKCPGNYFVVFTCTCVYLLLVATATLSINLVGIVSFTIALGFFVTIIYAVCGLPFCVFCVVEMAVTAAGTCPCILISIGNILAPLLDCCVFRYGIWAFTMIGRAEYNQSIDEMKPILHVNREEVVQEPNVNPDAPLFLGNESDMYQQYDLEDGRKEVSVPSVPEFSHGIPPEY